MNRAAALLVGLLAPFATASFAAAETTVTLEKTHLCCGNCVKAAAKAVDSVPGVKATCDQKTGTIKITAPDDAAGQKAIDALSAAGFYGKATGATIKDDSGAPAGKVASLSVTTHNCCAKCTKAIDAVIKSVDGAKGEAVAKEDTFTVTGNFDAAKLVQAFNDAGFSVKTAAK